MDILRCAAALRARDIDLPPIASLDSGTPSEVSHLQPKELVEYFKFKKGRDSPSEARGTLLIIAALVAAATFQVAFNPPGGIWQDNYFPNQNYNISTNTSKKHLTGWSILGTSSGVEFSLFALFNSIGFSISLYMIKILTSKFPLEFELDMSAGHVGFVREILRLRLEYAKEVNKDGFSPLHMAAANGHIEVVRELLNVDRKLCCLEGRENKTPLHFAAMRGRVDVISEMLSSCAECIEGVTVQKETALHLAIKNNQFEAIKVMIDWILEIKREDILNLKDEQGNTVLHLATWKKQRQVIELVLGSGKTTSGSLEVNAVNQSGLTALDVLQIFPSEAGDREIAEILQRTGAVRARDIVISPIPSYESHDEVINHPITQQRCQRQTDNLVEYFKFKKGRDSPSEARSALLVISVLVATATFQVGLNPPGGIWQDDYSPNQNNGTSLHGAHSAGNSIMGTNNGTAFALFVVFNSIGFAMSLFMINILTSKFPLQFELQVCMVALFFTYNTAITSIAPSSVKLFTIIITSVFSSITPLLTKLVKQILKLFKKLVVDIVHKVT